MLYALAPPCLSTNVSFFIRALKTVSLFIWVLALLLGGCSRTSGSRGDLVQKVFGSQQVLDAFLASREVSAQRLHLRRHDSINPGVLKGYDIAPEVPVAPREFHK